MILVTGASGLVGSHLVKELTRQGKTIKALYQNSTPLEAVGEAVTWIKGNILDVVFLEEVMQDIQQVYHCAAAVSFNPKKKNLLYKTNVEGTANVVNACLSARVQKLLHVSSVAALGKTKTDILVNEKMNVIEEIGDSTYAKTKFLAEMEVWRGIGEGLNAVIVNPSIILGAGNWDNGSSEIFQTIYKEFPWYTDGVSGFVYVQDVVHAMVMLMNSNIHAERFILNAENISFKEVFDCIANNFGKRAPHKKVTPFLAELVWRAEKIRTKLTKKDPLLTKETARAAQEKRYFDNSKLKQFFPRFEYVPIKTAIQDICTVLKQKYKLN